MKIENLLFLFVSSASIAMDKPSSIASEVSILAPSIKNTINIPFPTTVAYTSNGSTLVAATSAFTVCVCDPAAKNPRARIPIKDYVNGLDTNPQNNNQMAFQDASDMISIYDIETHKPIEQIQNSEGSVMLHYNNEGTQLLIATEQKSCKLVDLRSKVITALLAGVSINGAYYNPHDNNTVAVLSDKALQLYDIKGSKTTITIPLKTSLINAAFNRDGSKIIASCTGDLELFDTKTGESLACYNIKGKKIEQPAENKRLMSSNVVFFPDNDTFLASQWDGWMILADVNHPSYHGTFQIPQDTRYPQFFPFAVSPDGNSMPVSLTENGVVYVYDVSGLKEKVKLPNAVETKNEWTCLLS